MTDHDSFIRTFTNEFCKTIDLSKMSLATVTTETAAQLASEVTKLQERMKQMKELYSARSNTLESLRHIRVDFPTNTQQQLSLEMIQQKLYHLTD